MKNFAHDWGRPVDEEPGWEKHIPVDASFWNAKEAYRLNLGGDPTNRFLICYDNCIVEISFPWDAPITETQAEVIAKVATEVAE